MSRIKLGVTLAGGLLKKRIAIYSLGLILLLAQTGGHAAQPSDALKFFKNFFITGDYVVGGVGLWGQIGGTINMSGAPDGAEALAAFLYWQVVSTEDPAIFAMQGSFNGQPLSTPPVLPSEAAGPLGTQLSPITGLGGTDACLLNGGLFGGAGRRVYTYRADVLRFLDVVDGRHRINGAYNVALPNNGTLTRTLGASLVVIYRHPHPATPLSAIVMYDGVFTKQQQQTMSQRIEGFYDPASVLGQITYLVGSAQAGLAEKLTGPGISENDPFIAGAGNAWDVVTRPTASLAAGASFFDTTIAPRYTGLASLFNDCMTLGAIVYRTQVNDTDGDGLLNRWESESGLVDPNGEALPNLAAMGADPNHKDLFVEIGSMTTGVNSYTYGGVAKAAHTHLPSHEALKKVGDAFAAKEINVHFDLGTYPPGVADPYIVRGLSARGGESFDEAITQCTPGVADTPWTADQPWNCQFDDYPGTVGWKTGFRFLRDMPLTLSDDACDAAEKDGNAATTCDRVLDSNRRDMVHYVLFVHALGLPKESCLDPVTGFPNVTCQQTNALFHVPVTNSGVADFPGGDAMVALGGFDNASGEPVGTDYMQGGTLAHELGHTLGLRHGAVKLTSGLIEREPNCKPNYQSVMNYLFQLRGLLDDSGVPYVNFSGQTLPTLDETGLPIGLGSDVSTFASPPYRTGWYAPKANVAFGTAATKHCDGTPLLYGPDGSDADTDPDPLEPEMIRVDSATIAATANIDWNLAAGQESQDINFDGAPTVAPPAGPLPGLLHGFNDWENLRLNQVGSRRNVGGWYWVLDPMTSMYAAYIGPLSLNVGHGDLGHGDLGHGDLGHGDLGHGDLGHGDLGHGDLGHGDLGHGDLGQGDLDITPGQDVSAAEVSLELAAASGLLEAPTVKAFVRGTDGMGSNSSVPPAQQPWVPMGEPIDCSTLSPVDCHRIRVDWNLSSSANAFRVFREIEGSGSPVEITGFGYVQSTPGHFTLFDTHELPSVRFSYVVIARYLVDAKVSEIPSDRATLTAVNIVPVANSQSIATLEDTDKNITLDATDPDTTMLTFSIVTAPSHGVLTNVALPQLTYDPADNYNSYDGPESFTFKATESSTWNGLNQDSDPATVSITVTPVNDAPSFTKGADQTVNQGAPAQSVPNWATNISVGPSNEGLPTPPAEGQTVSFEITSNSNPSLFSAGPAISSSGTLTYTPDPTKSGSATIMVRLRDSGGTANGGIDTSGEATFTITVNPVAQITFQRTDVWLSTSSANRTFDLKAEVLKNGVPVLEKIISNTTLGYGTTFSKAIYKQISPFPTASPMSFLASDTLSVRVSIKLSASSPGGNNASGATRLWYYIPVPPAANDSHLHAKRNGTDVRYYLITAFKLQRDGSVSGPTQYIDAIVYKTGYTVLGTWSITGP